MTGPSEKQRRALIVTKALLLGYEFVPSEKGCYIRKPDGMWYGKYTLMENGLHGRKPVAFPAVWLAATKALGLSGVYDAEIARRSVGANSGPGAGLRKRGRKRGGAQSVPKSFGTGP